MFKGMDAIEKQIRSIAASLFKNNKIDILIGYEQGTVPFQSRPYFLHTPAGSERGMEAIALNGLIWNSFCTNNLAAYLPKYFERDPRAKKKDDKPTLRIGMVVKGCDLRSVTALVKEHQAPRQNLVLIGIPCQGMYDKKKLAARLTIDDVVSVSETDEKTLSVTTRGGATHSFAKDEYLQDACRECRFTLPTGTDILVEGNHRTPAKTSFGSIEAFNAKPKEERWEYFKQEMSKCIRCNACRQACPTCYCKECFADLQDVRWIGAGIELTDSMLYHIIRIFHQAGRCVECDACYRACPMGVDLRTFTKRMVKDVEELFGYVTDFSLEKTPPLSTFKEDDPEGFITEP